MIPKNTMLRNNIKKIIKGRCPEGLEDIKKMNVDDFEKIKDAPNCGLWVIEKNEQGKYKLKTDLPRI